MRKRLEKGQGSGGMDKICGNHTLPFPLTHIRDRLILNRNLKVAACPQAGHCSTCFLLGKHMRQAKETDAYKKGS
jgi:hypothetical protein